MDVKATILNSLSQTASAKVDDLTARGSRESKDKDISKVKKLSTDFESIFMEQIFHSMRSSVQKSGLINGGNAEEIYTSMLDSEYAKQMSSKGTGGLAHMIEHQLLQTMGVKSDSSPASLRKVAAENYERVGGTTLRTEQKRVTMKLDNPSAVKLFRNMGGDK
jgi:Rod binding domain-containing protein